jgi:hypothetical protein
MLLFIFILFVCLNVTSILFKGIKKKCGNVLILFFYEMGKIPHRKYISNIPLENHRQIRYL